MAGYYPGSGTEGADFFAKWCNNCRRDEAIKTGGDGCLILANSYCGIEPEEWQMWRGEPLCTAFVACDGCEYPHMAGNAVADLFPAAPKLPTQGEQIRMMIHATAGTMQ